MESANSEDATNASSADRANIIFDSDIEYDDDDLLGLAMLHALQDRNEVRIIAVTLLADTLHGPPFVDLVNHFYGHGGIPIGLNLGGVSYAGHNNASPPMAPPSTKFLQLPAERRRADGALVYPRCFTSPRSVPDALTVQRQVLSEQPDGSVVINVQGSYTNLARLLESEADEISALDGKELVRRKVKSLVAMGGDFSAARNPEFNLLLDVPAAQKVANEWPTPIVFSGVEVGPQIPTSASSITQDYRYVSNHPIVDAYKLFNYEYHGIVDGKKFDYVIRWPYNRPTWASAAVLYAARSGSGYFSLSAPGTVAVMPDGRVRFHKDPAGRHRYLILRKDQEQRALEAMTLLASQPPIRVLH